MKRLFFLLLIGAATSAHAQQDPLYAQYLNVPILINPAYAGFNRDVNTTATFRKQWAGFEGSPSTMNLASHIALQKNRMGAGLMVLEDKFGTNLTTEAQAMYAYHLPIATETTLSFGLQLGAINYRTDYGELTYNPNDPKFAPVSEWVPTFGTGIILTNDKYYFSLSLPKMLQPKPDSPVDGLYNRHFYAMAAYMFQPSFRIKLKPYALFRSSAGIPASYDLGVSLYGDDSYCLGVFTRNFGTYGFLAQIKLGDLFRVGYVFELPTNQSAGLNFTSHEILVGFRLAAFSFHDLDVVRNF